MSYYLDAIRYNENSEKTNSSYTLISGTITDLYSQTTVESYDGGYGLGFNPTIDNFNDNGTTYASPITTFPNLGMAMINLSNLTLNNDYNFSFNTDTTYANIEIPDKCKIDNSMITLALYDTTTPNLQLYCGNFSTSYSIFNITTVDKIYNYSFVSISKDIIIPIVDINPLVDFKNISYNYYNLTDSNLMIVQSNGYETENLSDSYEFDYLPIYWNVVLTDNDNITLILV